MATAASDSMGSALLQMVEMSQGGMALLDHEYRFVYANATACVLLETSADDLVGREFLVGFPSPERTALVEGFGAQTSARWCSLHRAAGRAFAIEYEARAHATPGGALLILGLRDVTEQWSEGARLPQNLTHDQLREREEQYRSIFESTNDGMLIVDLDGYIAEANAAACEMYGYSYGEFIGLHADALTHPDFRQDPAEALRLMEHGEALRSHGPNVRKDGSIFYVEGRGTRFAYRGEAHTLAVVRDVTERVQQYEILEQRVAERTRELSTLLEVSHNVASTLELQPLLRLILDQLKSVMDFDGATVMAVDGHELVNLHRQGPGGPDDLVQHRFPHTPEDLFWTYLQRGNPVLIGNVRDDEPLAEEYRRINGELVYTTLDYVRSWMGVPMILKDRVVGVLSLASRRPRAYTPHDASLVGAVANQAAIAIENARLYEQMARRSRELATLLEVSRTVASTLELKPLLRLILENLRGIVAYTGASILFLDGDALVFLQSRGPEDEEHIVGRRYPIAASPELWELISRGEPIVIDDVQSADPVALAFRDAMGADMSLPNLTYIRSWLGAPLKIKDRVSGVLSLSRDRPAAYSVADAELVMALANQVAVAIENARLYEKAQEVAVLEERQRLARELHDSVSQALYSIGLCAQTARALVEREPARAVEPLDYVLSLAHNGMAEMRGLLFELRPESLAEEGLVQALQKQTAAVGARHGVVIDTALCAEPEAGAAVKEALYRIAQEALHNTVKHARAAEIRVSLECTGGQMLLEIQDNGAGFDPSGPFPGHLGLHSMRERAANLGGTLEVESAPGAGTTLRARLSVHRDATR